MLRRTRNKNARDKWLADVIRSIPPGRSVLDVGAGECDYKPLCGHLRYTSQDIAQYDGRGDGSGLQTRTWDLRRIDLVCDLHDIPETIAYDAILCTEVLEHVTDPVRAVEKLARLLADGGLLVVTAPFNSCTHFAPYHFCTGFSRFFFQHHLARLGLEVQVLEPNGGFFDFMDQELGRTWKVRRRYSGWIPDPLSLVLISAARLAMRLMAALDGPRDHRKSSDLQTFGWHVVAVKPLSRTNTASE
jgi:SAM-dependent methyltransferase